MTAFSKIILMISISFVCTQHLIAEDGVAGRLGSRASINLFKNKLVSRLEQLRTDRRIQETHAGYKSLIEALNNYENAWHNQTEQGSTEALQRATQDAEMTVFSALGQLSGLEQKIHGAIFFEKECSALLELLTRYKDAWVAYAHTLSNSTSSPAAGG